MHRRLQFGMCENPASNRRHGSRLGAGRTEREDFIPDEGRAASGPPPNNNHVLFGADGYPQTASPRAVTVEKESGARKDFAESAPVFPQKPAHGFEPLIGSPEAAKLLGNIHIKTLQRYARCGNVPGYQIGGHWYF